MDQPSKWLVPIFTPAEYASIVRMAHAAGMTPRMFVEAVMREIIADEEADRRGGAAA